MACSFLSSEWVADPSELLLIGGRSGVGKSAVAAEIHFLLEHQEIKHAVIEGELLDLAYPEPWSEQLAQRNLRDMWENYRDLGFRRLVYTNAVSVVESDSLAQAMGDSPSITGVLLGCSDAIANNRLASRFSGEDLQIHQAQSATAATFLQEDSPRWVHRIATDDLSVNQVARRVLELAGWLPRAVSVHAG